MFLSFERVAQSNLEWISSKVDSGFQCLVGFRIPDSKAQDSGFHKQKFPGFWNPDSLTWGDLLLSY